MPPPRVYCPPKRSLSPPHQAAFNNVFHAMGDYISHVPLDGTSPLKPKHLQAISARLQCAKQALHGTPHARPIVTAIDNALAVLAHQPPPAPSAFCEHLQRAMKAFKPLETRVPVPCR